LTQIKKLQYCSLKTAMVDVRDQIEVQYKIYQLWVFVVEVRLMYCYDLVIIKTNVGCI
jgi:hypothetical protein